MQSKIQHNSREKKNLIKNIFSLGTLQTVDYLVPILLIPYLLRVIGIVYYGVLAFSAAIVTYFALLTDYGFNLSATRLVSLNRDNKEKLNEIFSAVLSLKILLFVIGLILITIVIFSIEKVGEHIEIVYLTFAMVLGTALFPLWLFQGLEKMGYITLINSSSKVFFALLIFVFVQDAEDFWLVPLLTSAGFIFGGVLGLWTASKIFAVTFKFCSITTLKYYLIEGKHAFVATAGSSLYRNSNIVILGLLTTPTLVGFYAIAEKVILIIQRLQGVFGLLMVLAPLIVTILTGNNEPQAVFLIQIMSVVILIGGMNYYYGILGLMTMDYKKSFSSFILVAGVFSLLSCTLLTYFFKDVGAALALILSELLLLSLILNKIHKIKKLSV
jgi:PST family polysaccharide transporter